MTKAERIYIATRVDCKEHIKTWGYEEGSGFTGLSYSDDEHFCRRTFNAVQKLLTNDINWNEFEKENGFITEDEYTEKAHLLRMVQNTLNNEAKGWGF